MKPYPLQRRGFGSQLPKPKLEDENPSSRDILFSMF